MPKVTVGATLLLLLSGKYLGLLSIFVHEAEAWPYLLQATQVYILY